MEIRACLADLASGCRKGMRLHPLRAALICVLSLASPQAALAEFFWTQDLTITGANTATGTVGGQSFTITSSNPIALIPHYQPGTFPSQYKVPFVQALREDSGATYTLTFASPVENPSISIASLGSSSTPKTFNFGAPVQIEYESHFSGTSFVYNNGSSASTTSIEANEGFVIARYNTTVSSVTFSVPPPGENYMTLLVGFDISADETTSTLNASPGTVQPDGASSATVTVQARDQFSNAFSVGGETVALSTTLGSLSSVTDNNDGTYTATLTATAEGTATITGTLNGASMTDTATVIFDDSLAPTVTVSTSDNTLSAGETATITFDFSEAVTGFDNSDLTITGGTLSTVTVDPIDATIYTATFTPGASYAGSYDVAVQAGSYEDLFNNAGSGGSTSGTANTVAPTVTFAVPGGAITGPFTLTATFSTPVTGLTAGEVIVANGTLTNLAGSGATYSLDITPVLGNAVTVTIPAGAAQAVSSGNDNAAGTITVQSGSPASEFARHKREIEDLIRGNAVTRIEQAGNLTRRQVREARSRFIRGRDARRQGLGNAPATRRVPFGGTGTFRADDDGVVGQGAFFGLAPGANGPDRLVYGDIDLAAREGGSTALTITARVAWEWMRDDSLFGTFIGVDAFRQNIDGSFDGREHGAALTFGGYGIGALGETTVGEAWLALFAGRSDIELDNGTLALDGGYGTLGILTGGGITGYHDMGTYELRPSITAGYSKAFVGDVNFTGTAYGLTSTGLIASPGDVERGELALALEYRRRLDGRFPIFGETTATAEPRVLCIHADGINRVNDCGAGVRLGLTGTERPGGTSTLNIDLTLIDGGVSHAMRFAFEQSF